MHEGVPCIYVHNCTCIIFMGLIQARCEWVKIVHGLWFWWTYDKQICKAETCIYCIQSSRCPEQRCAVPTPDTLALTCCHIFYCIWYCILVLGCQFTTGLNSKDDHYMCQPCIQLHKKYPALLNKFQPLTLIITCLFVRPGVQPVSLPKIYLSSC